MDKEKENEILKDALKYYMNMHGCALMYERDIDEASCNGYVCDKKTLIILKKAKEICGY